MRRVVMKLCLISVWLIRKLSIDFEQFIFNWHTVDRVWENQLLLSFSFFVLFWNISTSYENKKPHTHKHTSRNGASYSKGLWIPFSLSCDFTTAHQATEKKKREIKKRKSNHNECIINVALTCQAMLRLRS